MRNRQLHDALRAFALEAAALLRDDQAAGQELEFDLDEGHRRGGPALYHYRPLTARYIGARWDRLRFLPSAAEACEALDAGAEAYLRLNGLRGAEAEPALRALLERLYEELSDFAFPEERFERVYAEVESTLYEKSQTATVLVPVHGLELEADRIELGDALALVRGDRSDAPDEAVWAGSGDEPSPLLVLEREVAPDDPLPVEEARDRFARVLGGLRLFKPGGVALGAVAWRRTGDGRWAPTEMEPTGQARGAPWILVEGEDAELGRFLDAVADPPRTGPVAWALARFQMGAGRRLEAEALTDYLLALRALIDEGESSLALRVAVLCAEESERRRVQRRIELAQAMERFVIGDGADEDYTDAVGTDSPRTLVEEVERHLRALLRDVLCGYLDPDLRRVADQLLLDQPEPFEIKATALRPSRPAPEPDPQPTPVQEEVAQLEGQLGLDDAEYWSAPV